MRTNSNIRTLTSLLLLIAVFVFFEASISSCASKSSPSGGDKDTLAPRLDTAFPPNQTLFFKADKIILEFDEYLNLKSPQQNININPLLKEDLEIIARGKKVEILLKDTLRPNTTYIISFGKSLADLNEGNENTKFKYVFSTGSYIDSLHLSGTLRKAYSNEPLSNHLVGLYDVKKAEDRDSFLLKERPDYYTFTDETGSFGMSYLGEGDYLMVAFEEKGGTFKLLRRDSPLAFHSDTIRLRPDSLYLYDLVLFEPEPDFRFLNAKQKNSSKIQFAFNKEASNFKVEPLGRAADSSFFLWNKDKDTLNYYFSFKADSLQFKLNYDSLFVDSIYTIRLREMKEPELSINTAIKQLRPWDSLPFRSSMLLKGWNPDSIYKINDKDTLNVSLLPDSTDPFLWYLPPPHPRSFKLRFKPGAFYSEKLQLEDSVDFKVDILKGEDLGTLTFKVVADSAKAMILQIVEENDRILLEQSFRDSTSVLLKNTFPRKLKAFIIIDEDGNGEYTTGDFYQGRQAEKRVPYREELEIRANWELELEWRYRAKQAINKEPLLKSDSTAVGQ
ncbi:Ig-like domain-containing protein [Croceimicrobium hydrocarbonivorans]|uniref:Ig-like domain-containing protein n=1 Tax=Croceimicrobium hydrocarbonivorans TaxID=2761580 RepID=A0A7H0VIL7_9FLAO|nr:Ig-like domain-containing protein [Croceimicrobium hydrocarbonivorans]QNR25565.1 Ig-like domain-containing protein [Croceimicrobium hydrocarbonivorans]